MKIIQEGDKILRQKAKEVEKSEISSEKIKNLITGMKNTLSMTEEGVAIAAPQVAESLRIFVVAKRAFDVDDFTYDERKTVYINPVILKSSKQQVVDEEGCLSVAGIYGKVSRAEACVIKALDENGEEFTLEAVGFLARVFQHETDHLNGILFIDKLIK